MEDAAEEEFNFMLVDEYKNGQDYMGEHRDDESCMCSHTSITPLFVGQREGCHTLTQKILVGNQPNARILNQSSSVSHGSLLVMRWPTNSEWHHIMPVHEEGGIRP